MCVFCLMKEETGDQWTMLSVPGRLGRAWLRHSIVIYSVFFPRVCGGCCAPRCLCNPSQETCLSSTAAVQTPLAEGRQLSCCSLLPVVPASVRQGIFSGVWGRALGNQRYCSGVLVTTVNPTAFLLFPGIQTTAKQAHSSALKLQFASFQDYYSPE